MRCGCPCCVGLCLRLFQGALQAHTSAMIDTAMKAVVECLFWWIVLWGRLHSFKYRMQAALLWLSKALLTRNKQKRRVRGVLLFPPLFLLDLCTCVHMLRASGRVWELPMLAQRLNALIKRENSEQTIKVYGLTGSNGKIVFYHTNSGMVY